MAKVLISVPDDLLDRIDDEAKRRLTTRSAFLQEAARRELGGATAAAIDAAVERARLALADAGSFESTDVIRADRDARDSRDPRR